MLYEISNEKLKVKISDVGAEIKSVLFFGIERSWQNDNGEWNGTSPVLFPVCGRTGVAIGGKDYQMPFHGFARHSVFTCEKLSDQEAVFTLKSSGKTFEAYPYSFTLTISYKIFDDTITVTNRISNDGDTPMPFALGRHDSFVLSNPVGNYKLCFLQKERFLSQETDNTGRLVDSFVDFGAGSELPVPEGYLTDGKTIIFGNINSNGVTLKTLDNRPIARVLFGKIKNLLVWRPNFAQMLCIEPWSALPDAQYKKSVDFTADPRFIKVAAGKSETLSFEIKYY